MAEQTKRNPQSNLTGTERSNKPSSIPKPSSAFAAEEGNGGLMKQVKSSASDALETATNKAAEKLEQQKSNLTSGLTSVASGIREMGTSLASPGSDNQFARIASEASSVAAKGIDRAADYFDQHDLNAMYHDVEDLARRNPAIFLGGAFALGFLAARFLKSTKPRRFTTAAGQPFDMPQQNRPRMGADAARGL